MQKNCQKQITVSDKGLETVVRIQANLLTNDIVATLSSALRTALSKRKKKLRIIFYACHGVHGSPELIDEILKVIQKLQGCEKKGLHVIGEVEKHAKSAAAFLFLACDECIFWGDSYIDVHSIHPTSSIVNLDQHGKLHEKIERKMTSVRKRLSRLLKEKTRLSAAQVRRILYAPGMWRINGDLAQQLGITHRELKYAI